MRALAQDTLVHTPRVTTCGNLLHPQAFLAQMQKEMHKAVIQGDATMAMSIIKRDNVQVISSASQVVDTSAIRCDAYLAETELLFGCETLVQKSFHNETHY